MADESDRRRWTAYWQDEIDSATVYRAMAAAEDHPQLAEVYRRLAATEADHAAFWAARLAAAGNEPGPAVPTRRARVLAWLARRFGPDLVVPVMRGGEVAGGAGYAGQPEAAGTGMAADERSHDRLLALIAETPGPGAAGPVLARLEGRHRRTSGNALRAAVLGANDGLVSNLSLVMGVAGAALASGTVLVTGLAGLVAGAGSMAMGEWLSVQSSRELYRRQLAVEAAELESAPEAEAAELALIYEAKGLDADRAAQVADRLVGDRGTALDTLAREELGIDPDELGGSALEAAGTSFLLFALGAVVPVLPFFWLAGSAAIGTSLALSVVALFAIGAGITLLTGRGVLGAGGRQVAIGLAAAAMTFGVGRLIGTTFVG